MVQSGRCVEYYQEAIRQLNSIHLFSIIPPFGAVFFLPYGEFKYVWEISKSRRKSSEQTTTDITIRKASEARKNTGRSTIKNIRIDKLTVSGQRCVRLNLPADLKGEENNKISGADNKKNIVL